MGRGLREFGGYRATSTRRPTLLCVSAISLGTSIGYAVRVGAGSKLHPMARKKRGKLSESAPVVRPLGAKGKDRIPNHEKIVVITHATLDSVMQ